MQKIDIVLERHTERPVQLRWGKKRPISKNMEGKSYEKEKLSWN